MIRERYKELGIPVGPDKKKIVDELTPDEDDIFLTKWRYNAFKKTNLLEILNEQGRDQFIIYSIYAHICYLLTACEAFMDGVQREKSPLLAIYFFVYDTPCENFLIIIFVKLLTKNLKKFATGLKNPVLMQFASSELYSL